MTINLARYRARTDAGTWHLSHGTHTSHKRPDARVSRKPPGDHVSAGRHSQESSQHWHIARDSSDRLPGWNWRPIKQQMR